MTFTVRVSSEIASRHIHFFNQDDNDYGLQHGDLDHGNRFEFVDTSGTVVEHKVTTLKMDQTLYFIMITVMNYIDEETKKVEKEIEEWEKKASTELARRLWAHCNCYPAPYIEWEEKNPFKQSNPHFSTNVGRLFNHRFKTVVSIKETLNDLQVILGIYDGEEDILKVDMVHKKDYIMINILRKIFLLNYFFDPILNYLCFFEIHIFSQMFFRFFMFPSRGIHGC